MRFIIENPNYATIDRFIFALKACKPLRAIGMENIRRDAHWVTTRTMDIRRLDGGVETEGLQTQEYKLVIAFDLPWEDAVIPVLTNLFESSGFTIASLDNPQLRFSFG